MKYAIDIDGSEGSTTVVMKLTEAEFSVIARLTHLVNKTAAESICQPTINLRKPESHEKETQP